MNAVVTSTQPKADAKTGALPVNLSPICPPTVWMANCCSLPIFSSERHGLHVLLGTIGASMSFLVRHGSNFSFVHIHLGIPIAQIADQCVRALHYSSMRCHVALDHLQSIWNRAHHRNAGRPCKWIIDVKGSAHFVVNLNPHRPIKSRPDKLYMTTTFNHFK